MNAGPAVLGGNEQAFINKFGAPDARSNLPSGDLHFVALGSTDPDGLQVGLDIADGVPYNQRAEIITAQNSSGGSWALATALSKCGSFIPQDATKTKTLTLLDSLGKVNGEDVAYFSPWLAKQFPAGSFQDGKQGQQVQAGLFDITYYYALNNDLSNYNPNQITYCELAVGTTGDTFAG